MRRILSAVVAAMLLGSQFVLPTTATTASISPTTQSHAYGVASTWTDSWGGSAPFEVRFFTGDGYVFAPVYNTQTQMVVRHAFYPCRGTTYRQTLTVIDRINYGIATNSSATEGGGGPC
jgi:hypothetical protein